MVNTTLANPFGSLYANPFEPGLACDNLLASDDAMPGSFADDEVIIELNLTPGDYTLVTTTSFVGETGSFQWSVNGPSPIAALSWNYTIKFGYHRCQLFL
ncbi:MAG: hypothetical protein R2784_04080 [Saprospiraceae bacterium]